MKRFYKAVDIREARRGYQILLDQRPVKTALGHAQIVPTCALADILAREWDAQGDEIDPDIFRHRDLADFAIDMVAPDHSGTHTKLLGFGETDTLCYRADPDDPLFRRQQDMWEPVLQMLEQRENIVIERISGVIHRPQSQATRDRLSAKLETLDPFTLTSLLTMTSLAASLAVGLNALEDGADPQALWAAANLEEDWQIEQWGSDHEAETVRARRKADFLNAWAFGRLASDRPAA